MAEKQIAQAFSEQVDRLLAGQAAPGDDPLLSLAADLTPGEALDPAPTFVRRLRGQLLRPAPPRRALRLRRWSLAGAALSLFIVLAWTMLWKPRTLSAAEVLARAADATAVNPGQIEYIVLKVDSVTQSDEQPVESTNTIVELWNHIAVNEDGLLTVAEWAWTAYAASDTGREHPLYQSYNSPILACMDSLDASFPDVPQLRNCITLNLDEPDPAARQAAESLQEWVARLQASEAEIEFHETEFSGRLVYSLTYLEENRHVFVSATSPSGGTGAVTQAYTSMDTVTVYIDRETYLPVGKLRQDSFPSPHPLEDEVTTTQTQTVLQYQVLNPEELDFDPFAWPPER
jgi:hypothetical protein